MYEVCALYPPFVSKTLQAQEAKIREGRLKPLPFTFSGELYCLIKSMLRADVSTRFFAAGKFDVKYSRLSIYKSNLLQDVGQE